MFDALFRSKMRSDPAVTTDFERIFSNAVVPAMSLIPTLASAGALPRRAATETTKGVKNDRFTIDSP